MQKGQFFTSNNIQKETLEGYKVGWHSKPSITETEHLIVIEENRTGIGYHKQLLKATILKIIILK